MYINLLNKTVHNANGCPGANHKFENFHIQGIEALDSIISDCIK